MRKLILFMHMSLDGYVCGPNGELDWATMNDDEVGKYLIGDLLTSIDAMLIGRNLYQGFQSYWPAQVNNENKDLADFAKWIDKSPKYVYSHTLKNTDWQNSFVINGDLKEEVTKLKHMQGKDIVVFGGAQMSSSLAGLNLIDEYRLKLEPVVLGNGNDLFKDVNERMNLNLVKGKKFDSGVQALYYSVNK